VILEVPLHGAVIASRLCEVVLSRDAGGDQTQAAGHQCPDRLGTADSLLASHGLESDASGDLAMRALHALVNGAVDRCVATAHRPAPVASEPAELHGGRRDDRDHRQHARAVLALECCGLDPLGAERAGLRLGDIGRLDRLNQTQGIGQGCSVDPGAIVSAVSRGAVGLRSGSGLEVGR